MHVKVLPCVEGEQVRMNVCACDRACARACALVVAHALARFFSARSSIRNFCASKFLSACDARAFPPGLPAEDIFLSRKTEKTKMKTQ
jgi:hypothetical protein